ncbi:MAG: DUF927 domain-containing protein [Acidobacteriaceae bacterium]|nr:DUF927 domain-containing protein [Acidobacteriaceae bacterium]
MSENKSSSKKSKTPVAKSRVVIEGEGRDEWGNRYFKFSVVGSDHDIPPISVEQLLNDPKPLFTALGNAGWNAFIPKVRNQLLGKLQKRKPKASSFEVVTRLGWNSGAFVLADKVVGHPKKRLEKALGDLDQAMLQKYRAKGTLKQWQEKIAVPCSGNSRLMFAVSLAFTGPILPFVRGPRAGGFQIWGPAETGKTTAAMVAGSVWGCHRREGRREKGFAESWNSTKNKIEVTALAHNHTLLILDETKGAGGSDRQRAEVVTLVVFGLAECTEKERLTNATPARSWRCYFLSTSNLSLAQLGRRGKVAIDEAHLGRLADIPLPSNGRGIYEKLHGFADWRTSFRCLAAPQPQVLRHGRQEICAKIGRQETCRPAKAPELLEGGARGLSGGASVRAAARGSAPSQPKYRSLRYDLCCWQPRDQVRHPPLGSQKPVACHSKLPARRLASRE